MDESYATYESILRLLKEYRDNIEYNYLLDILIVRYELTLIKYKMFKESIYTNILLEIETIIRWFIVDYTLN